MYIDAGFPVLCYNLTEATTAPAPTETTAASSGETKASVETKATEATVEPISESVNPPSDNQSVEIEQ